ncbi:MAG: GLUG motif-containing protein [Planctomycetota bacterium]
MDAGNDYPRLSWEGTPGIPLPIPTYGGGSGSEEDPYLIYTVEQFNDIGLYECHQASHFKLMEDIVFDPDQDSNYSKIGENVSFYGVFDGNFHRIINPRYTQDDPAVNGTGIFKAIDGYHGDGVVKNLGVENPEITSAGNAVGGLAGSLVYGGTIDNCYVKGGSISGSDATGGLVGSVSMQNNNLVRNSYSNTIVSGNAHVGGLVSYFTGGTVEHSYAAGPVNGNSTTGGLVGYFDPAEVTVTESFYDSETTGQTGGLGTELATLQMQMLPSYTNWDFTNTWRICDGMNYPRLQWEPRPVGDFVCPEGVEINDLMILSDEWLVETMSADMAPEGGDGKVDLADWAHLTNAWMSSTGQADWDADCDIAPETPDGQINELDLTEFAGQWLYRSARFADIAPASAPDGRVDLLDYSLFSENWLLGVD